MVLHCCNKALIVNGQEFPPAYSAPVIRFATFEVDLRAKELRRNGLKVSLQKQPFQILEMLLERTGELVTREEIRSRIWPADTFIDFEHSVNTAVKKLRQALGDRAENPVFIETLPRQGFRFIAELRSSAPAAVLEPAPTSEAVPVAPLNSAPPVVVPSVPQPVRGRRVLWGALIGALAVISMLTYRALSRRQDASGQAMSTAAIQSIAVLPLANLSSDPEQEYFSDGLTDELITRLAQIRSLHVISRSSVVGYKHTLKKAPEIGQELHVDALVEGTVERVQDRVRIRVQVIRTSADQHLWAESYDRELKDVLQLESDVAREIAHRIGQVASAQGAQFAAVRMVSLEAHENFLKGRYRWNQRTEAGLLAAIRHFQRAIELDSRYAQAYAGLADSYIMMANWGFMPAADAYPNAESAARKALEIDDQLAEAHTSLAYATFLYRWDWSGAEKRFQRAIELNPNYATALHFYSRTPIRPGYSTMPENSRNGSQLRPRFGGPWSGLFENGRVPESNCSVQTSTHRSWRYRYCLVLSSSGSGTVGKQGGSDENSARTREIIRIYVCVALGSRPGSSRLGR